jgi:hypothetical protein
LENFLRSLLDTIPSPTSFSPFYLPGSSMIGATGELPRKPRSEIRGKRKTNHRAYQRHLQSNASASQGHGPAVPYCATGMGSYCTHGRWSPLLTERVPKLPNLPKARQGWPWSEHGNACASCCGAENALGLRMNYAESKPNCQLLVCVSFVILRINHNWRSMLS